MSHIVEPLDFDDPEAQDPEPLPKGTECGVEIRSGNVNTDYGFVSIFIRPVGEEWENHYLSPYTLNQIDPSDEPWQRKNAKRNATRFCEGFGITAAEYNSAVADAFELAENGEDAAEALAAFEGKKAQIVSTIKKDRPQVGRFLVNQLEAKKDKKAA